MCVFVIYLRRSFGFTHCLTVTVRATFSVMARVRVRVRVRVIVNGEG